MFKLWSDYHVYVSTITKKYLLGKSVVIYRSFELLVCRDQLFNRLVRHTWVRWADAKVYLMIHAAYITFSFNLWGENAKKKQKQSVKSENKKINEQVSWARAGWEWECKTIEWNAAPDLPFLLLWLHTLVLDGCCQASHMLHGSPRASGLCWRLCL